MVITARQRCCGRYVFSCVCPPVSHSVHGLSLVTNKMPLVSPYRAHSSGLASYHTQIPPAPIFVSVTLLPVSPVQSLTQTSSIVSGVILFYLFVDDKPILPVLLSALMCTCRVLCVIQPNFVFTHVTNENSFSVSSKDNQTKFSFDSFSNSTNSTTNDSPVDHYSQKSEIHIACC